MTTTFTSDQAQHIMQQTAASLQHPALAAALGGPNAAKCWSCKIGLNVAAGAAVAAAIAAIVASGGAAAIPEAAVIAAATGLSEAAVGGILASVVAGGGAGGATAVEMALEALCKAMKACD